MSGSRALPAAAALAVLAGAHAAPAETLFDAIRLAYDSNPALRAQRAQQQATDEDYVQAKAGLGPQINVTGQEARQWARVDQSATIFTQAGHTDYHATTGSADLSVVQPVFSSGAKRAQVEGAKAGVMAGREDLRQTEAQLLQAVIQAYEDVRRDRQSIAFLQEEIAALSRDFEEIKAKGAAGQLTKTDVAESGSRLLDARAQLHLAMGRLDSSVAEYMDVVGQSPGDLAPEPDLPGVPKTVEAAFDAADQNNPQLRSALQSELAARQKVAEAKAAYGPTLALRFDAQIQPIEPYLPNQYDRDVSISAVYNQPLFTSGLNASKVRQALDQDNQAQLAVERARRDAVQQVSKAWSTLGSSRDAISIQAEQVEAEHAAVVGNRIEQRAGTRSTFELMNAEFELTNSQLSLLQSRHDEYLARAQLLAAMGVLEARYLTPGGQTYDPVVKLKRVEGVYAAPWEGAVEALDGMGMRQNSAPRLSAPGAGSARPDGLRPSLPPEPDPAPKPETQPETKPEALP
jgi:outer membrane protein